MQEEVSMSVGGKVVVRTMTGSIYRWFNRRNYRGVIMGGRMRDGGTLRRRRGMSLAKEKRREEPC